MQLKERIRQLERGGTR